MHAEEMHTQQSALHACMHANADAGIGLVDELDACMGLTETGMGGLSDRRAWVGCRIDGHGWIVGSTGMGGLSDGRAWVDCRIDGHGWIVGSTGM
eukprot:354162-Chlamydomonas_euryale.AAC.1